MNADKLPSLPKNLLSTTNPMLGITARQWFALLRNNQFAVHAEYWPRAMAISVAASINSFFAAKEQQQHGDAIAATTLKQDPIFILGHWRSGTTHLHYLMCEDEQFCAPNNYQASRPDIFLNGGEQSLPTRIADQLGLIPKTRPMDEMKVDVDTAAEDEQALFMHCGLSPIGAWLFPENTQHYDRFIDFSDATEAERALWKKSVKWFNQKLSYRYPNRQLVLKSPPHTARIPLLLELYPNAKFIHLQRDPLQVYRSFFHFYSTLITMINLQRMSVNEVQNTIIHRYRLMYDSYFQHRDRIPKGNLIEISFEDLESRPMQQMQNIYQQLGLENFNRAQPRLLAYLKSVQQYKKNAPQEMPQALRHKLHEAWRPSFENWGYPLLDRIKN